LPALPRLVYLAGALVIALVTIRAADPRAAARRGDDGRHRGRAPGHPRPLV